LGNETSVYPFRWWQHWSKAARVRRAQLNINMSRVKQKVPYARFVLYIACFLIVLNPFIWLMNAAIGFLLDSFLYFILYSAATSIFLATVVLYSWVQKYWPVTVKVQVGNSPLFTAGDHVPGHFTDSVELPSEDPTDNPSPPKKPVTVEIIPCGTVKHIPPTFAPMSGPIVIARCTVLGDSPQGKALRQQAGHLRGLIYYIPAKPEVFIAGDLKWWRGIDWVEIAKRHVPGKVNDFTLIILALDLIKDEKWESPPDPPGAKMELFEARLRIAQLQARFANYVAQDQAVKEALSGGEEL